MQCQHCGLVNGEDDHRCLRCGRRMAGVVIAAPASYGATALAMSVETAPERDWQPAPSPQQSPLFQQAPQPAAKTSRTPAQNVIPFEEVQRQAAGRGVSQPPFVFPANP